MFNMPFGTPAATSLPMLLRQQMMAGQAPGPLPGPTALQQAQLTPGFHAGGGMGGMGMQQPQQQPGFSMQDGMNGLSAGLSAYGKANPGQPNAGMPEDAKLGGAVAGINALQPGADGQFAQPTMPTDIGSGGGGGMLSNLWQKLGFTGPGGLF